MRAARGVIGVLRLGEEDAVEDRKAPCVARAHAKEDEGLRRVARLNEIELLARHAEADEVFYLREEQILGRADGIELFRQLQPLAPEREIRLTGCVVRGDIELLLRRERGEQSGKLRKQKLFHCAPPRSYTTDGSQSSLRKSMSGGRESKSAPA